ncbi:MAG: AAA family ATPase [archaeon]|nr:AAA family ATPase [archaeon]
MKRKIAVYGKGGIGKSTVSSNLTAALSDTGLRVLQIGCDPKHDSTRALIGGNTQSTVLDYLKEVRPEDRRLGDVVTQGYKGCLCVEAGGPEPGVGCAGRGIISAFDLLERLGSDSIESDITIYDVLGDVVCGGFAVPLRNDYADTVYIVTSGEFMAIYAANNILRGTANYNPDRIGGIIFNSRGDPEEESRAERFSGAVVCPIIARIGRSPLFMEAEREGQTVVERFPDSEVTHTFRDLAQCVVEGRRHTARYLSESELERLILGRETQTRKCRESVPHLQSKEKIRPYTARNVTYDESIHGCAFSGASSVCTSVEGLTTVLHSPRSCAHFTVQLDSCSVKGSCVRGYQTHEEFLDPDVVCTDMTEDTMVFGGNNLLRNRILEQVDAGRRDIAVITACPPGIIGDDAREVARQVMLEHPDVRIAVMDEDGNATGDFMQGVMDAGIELARTFSVKGETIPDSLNLVGVKTMSSSAQSELDQVTEILGRIGIRVNCVLPGFCSMEDIADIPNAAASLKLNPDVFTEKVCMFLEDEYGIPTIPTPVRGGLKGTADWIRAVAGQFGKDPEPVIRELSERFDRMMEGPRRLLQGKRCAVVTIGNDVSWIKEAIDRSGMVMERGYVLHRTDYNRNLNSEWIDDSFTVAEEKDVGRIIEEIDALCPDILLVPVTAKVNPRIYQSRLPCAPTTDPFAGRLLAEDWIRGVLAPKEEEWRRDVA